MLLVIALADTTEAQHQGHIDAHCVHAPTPQLGAIKDQLIAKGADDSLPPVLEKPPVSQESVDALQSACGLTRTEVAAMQVCICFRTRVTMDTSKPV
jgi:hypothetical protein